ncbi:glycosyltransferase [Pelagibacteraceae bacterium]|nr:glycosyltransferase [Pelagibacteraceae bacterium]
MKKILFVSTRYPFSNIYSGDRVRSSSIIKFISKNNKVDLICSDDEKNKNIKAEKIFVNHNLFIRIFNVFISVLKLKPLQNGFFFNEELKQYINNNHQNYETIIFHLIRSAQYLPASFKGNKILEMTDLYSNNYNQTSKNLSIFNPMFYIYFLEEILVKKYEKECSNRFDKIILVSKKDLKNKDKFFKKNFIEIPNGIKKQSNVFKFLKKNKKILFIGNIKYLPNKLACYEFAQKILPKINIKFKNIEFHIVGDIYNKDKFYLNKIKNVKVIGKKNNLHSIIKNSFCGISNLKIATGFQNKILTYMVHGLPSIVSKKSFSKSSILKKNHDLFIYNDNNELIKYILKLKTNKIISKKISQNAYLKSRKYYNWNKVLKKYNKII